MELVIHSFILRVLFYTFAGWKCYTFRVDFAKFLEESLLIILLSVQLDATR